jgi:hypothetical protein
VFHQRGARRFAIKRSLIADYSLTAASDDPEESGADLASLSVWE